jgi:cytochrome c-type biogenesis protein CcmE
MRKRHWIILLIVISFFSFSALTFSNSLTPYVTFSQANATNATVQVRGVLADNKAVGAANVGDVRFRLRDEAGEEVTVLYNGLKPDGLDQASSIVAIGKYQNGQFNAEKLLVKCPSKYQGGAK